MGGGKCTGVKSLLYFISGSLGEKGLEGASDLLTLEEDGVCGAEDDVLGVAEDCFLPFFTGGVILEKEEEEEEEVEDEVLEEDEEKDFAGLSFHVAIESKK
jgi:hypothetical protein